jgi:transposase
MSDTRSPAQPPGAAAFSADAIKRRMAEREAAKAAQELQHMREQEEHQKKIMEEFQAPPERTPEQLLQLITTLVDRAAEQGQTEVQIYRFPNELCTDRGRAINNFEEGWDKTLTGRPKLAYDFWHDRLRPLGFGLKAEILEYPGGMPGDVGFSVTWK